MATVYFDGTCSLCNGFVDFLIRHDRRALLRFAPLQGATARARLPAELIERMGSVVFEDARGLATESTAAVRTLVALGGPWRLASALIILPPFLRNAVYRFIARNRYAWFGRRATCRVPTADERARFLD